eukprot:7587458-Ditylum_brightwellii.AAC.1
MPKASLCDAASHAALDLIEALDNLALPALLLAVGNKQGAILRQLVDIFYGALPQHKPPPVQTTPMPQFQQVPPIMASPFQPIPPPSMPQPVYMRKCHR